MNEQQRNMLKIKMQEELENLNEEITQLEQSTQPISPDNAIGRVSRMDAIGNKMVNEQALNNAKSKRAQLITVLDKIDKPDFGKCMYCMQPIRFERLMAMPESTLCMRCAR